MIRSISKVFVNSSSRKSAALLSRRSLAYTGGGIPTDAEQQGGRRKMELDAIARGEVGFNVDPIIPPVDAGTLENPILVSYILFHFHQFKKISEQRRYVILFILYNIILFCD